MAAAETSDADIRNAEQEKIMYSEGKLTFLLRNVTQISLDVMDRDDLAQSVYSGIMDRRGCTRVDKEEAEGRASCMAASTKDPKRVGRCVRRRLVARARALGPGPVSGIACGLEPCVGSGTGT